MLGVLRFCFIDLVLFRRARRWAEPCERLVGMRKGVLGAPQALLAPRLVLCDEDFQIMRQSLKRSFQGPGQDCGGERLAMSSRTSATGAAAVGSASPNDRCVVET